MCPFHLKTYFFLTLASSMIIHKYSYILVPFNYFFSNVEIHLCSSLCGTCSLSKSETITYLNVYYFLYTLPQVYIYTYILCISIYLCQYILIYISAYILISILTYFLYISISLFIHITGTLVGDFGLEWPYKLNYKSTAGRIKTVGSERANTLLLKHQ